MVGLIELLTGSCISGSHRLRVLESKFKSGQGFEWSNGLTGAWFFPTYLQVC